jgi:hypothetical protein
MKMRNCNARSAATVALVTLYLLLTTTIAKADTIFDISVKATFAEGTANQVINPTPNFYLTGHFTLDDTTTPDCLPFGCNQLATITSFHMVLTPVGSNAYAFSSETGSAQAFCINCYSAMREFWEFSFSDSNASIGLPTIDYTPSQPLAPGGTYYLGSGSTYYPDGSFVLPWGLASAGASFGGTTGWTYGAEMSDVLTSGYIHVDAAHAVPEPPEFSMLLVGLGVLLGVRRFQSLLQKGRPFIMRGPLSRSPAQSVSLRW